MYFSKNVFKYPGSNELKEDQHCRGDSVIPSNQNLAHVAAPSDAVGCHCSALHRQGKSSPDFQDNDVVYHLILCVCPSENTSNFGVAHSSFGFDNIICLVVNRLLHFKMGLFSELRSSPRQIWQRKTNNINIDIPYLTLIKSNWVKIVV